MAADTVLIADGDADTREILALGLARAGYRTLVAEDGERAVALLSGQRPALVITDLYIPAAGERCLLRWIKTHPEHGRLPVVVYTARLAPADLEWIDRQRCDLLLAKPTSILSITRCVGELLGQPSQRSAAAG